VRNVKRPGDRPFTRLDGASGALLRRLKGGRPQATLLAEHWLDLVGPYLARKIEPKLASDGALDIVLLDSRCRRSVEALLPQLEEKVKAAFPKITNVRLRTTDR
jgi:Dna[CI] antecedent, DciA